ncbi:MAG: hypothetical protein OWQ59_06660 [Alicyclobacillaceae bacterium]|jgi:hypothetical protein|uniref:hypothetical protein n=1 Tax=Alicyclobacillus sp. SP_1 TaxID=2942475 RepID=UPI002158540D|nr:hypothetical protein [Alicyclobacillus sp. SP_1]MCY0888125.1 hypothetical protein [Alicyclobacillaceae bacterium]MCY0895271.1 hypothetical protein [Alicyclobacillaceae bacterium]
MWEMMNGVANSMRGRFMPRRRSGIGTMTALVIGASVGIAAWEALRKSQPMSRTTSSSGAAQLAQEVLSEIQE